ncbi:MAG TPA: tRNA epoxyqueuosine(34) reductase QueG [Candidatus Binataceae bacterium]|nr:tRNA epoxyqueuosine(34) reductase QueG [Candidatus Binataceae bacterium]
MNSLNHRIDEAARRHGFVLVGFSRLRELPREAFYREWLANGRAGEMDYLAREPERRFDPRRLDPRLRSVISLGYPYESPRVPDVDWRIELRGRIASYALGEDYHRYVLRKARAVAAALGEARPGSLARVYIDTGPVLEREWAREAGIGWFGKNTNILNRERGSYVFLAEIFTDLELDATAEPYGDYCGTCRRCLDLCPTQALADGYLMEPRLCISYLTIELRGPIPVELRPKLGNWIFGCDICQEVCPWNPAPNGPGNDQLAPSLPELMKLDEEGFRRRFRGSAVKRTKRRGLLRNVAVALGNSGNPEAVATLAPALESEPEPLVRAHVAWSLGRLGGVTARRALEKARIRDDDPSVRRETDDALATNFA